MAAPNANPTYCDGISVACCPKPVPEALKATFSGANTCGFNQTLNLRGAGVWTVSGVGCQGLCTLTFTCAGSIWSLMITSGGGCSFLVSAPSPVCDGPEGFKVVFTVTQTGFMTCPCCATATGFTVTITSALDT